MPGPVASTVRKSGRAAAWRIDAPPATSRPAANRRLSRERPTARSARRWRTVDLRSLTQCGPSTRTLASYSSAAVNQVAGAILSVDAQLRQQAVADHHAARPGSSRPPRRRRCSPRIAVVAADVGPPLADEVPGHVVRIAAADRRDRISPRLSSAIQSWKSCSGSVCVAPELMISIALTRSRPAVEVLADDRVVQLAARTAACRRAGRGRG